MAEPILDKASYSLVRTNPKLTGNVKLLTNGNELYLESFSANNVLSSSSFKAFKIDGTLTYDQDVYKFFKKGTLPTDLAYEVFQEFSDTSVLSSYDNQYEMFYSAGTRSLSSEAYTEDLGILAPLWLNEQIPNYFVVFRVNDPSSVNNVNAFVSNEGETAAQTAERFTQFILQNCTAIKTFDLTQNSKLGSYIRRYVNQDAFPKAPLTVSWRQDEPILWNGISYTRGGFTSGGSYSYDSLIVKDATILQNEYFFTQGFQRNGILCANLINFEFLFSDANADDYSINRYFGLYVDEVTEGSFKISGEGFYTSTEKSQLPKIKTITEVSQFLNKPLTITNPNGVLLYLDESSIQTTTGIPTPTRVNQVESIFYVKDKNSQFHTIKKGSVWGNNQLRLFDAKIDISTLTGFNNPDTFANAQILSRQGKSTAYIEVIGEVPNGTTIKFYDGVNLVGQVSANESLTNGPGSSFESFFNPKGTTAEIATAINKAITFGIGEEKRFFNSSINNSTVYLQSRFGGTRFNRLRFSINWTEYPEIEDAFVTYPVTSELAESVYFVGGTDKENSLLLVSHGDQDRFVKGDYVNSKAGFVTISDWVPYLDEPIISGNGTQTGYRNIDNYVVIALDNNQIDVTKSGQVALYVDFSPSFGRFSFYPIKDFDFDFYSDMYSQLGELNFEIDYYNQFYESSTGMTGMTGVTGITGVTGGPDYFGISDWPDIRNFYNDGGFSNLIGLLRDADPDVTFDIDITSEYQRLEENFLKEQATASRIIPYINKWVWYDGGTDVRNNPYRLNLSLAFGTNNFAPSKWDTERSPQGFSHEWYYLCNFPAYFSSDAIESSWSYFDKKPVDNIEPNTITGQPFVLGTFQRVDKNEFDSYFIADRFDVNGSIHLIDRQLRFGRFSGGNKQNFAEAFLRGVRIIAKNKTSGEEKPNFNASKLSYIADGSFNDYRFSVMVIPNEPGKPNNQIKIIKNDKWKTIVMLIFISFENGCLNPFGNSIDRTLLYSMNSDLLAASDCSPISPLSYEDSIMQGSISFNASLWSSSIGQWLIQGVTDSLGNPTSFFTDITIGIDGQYNSIEFTAGGDTYLISGISKVISSNQLYATTITKNGVSFSLPSPSPSPIDLKSATYFIKSGGYNGYSAILNRISFANIFNAINDGDPSVVYETIDKNGNRLLNQDGTVAQTFGLQLRAQDDILKSTYIGILPDPNKPTVFNLSDIIGYDLSLQTKPRINPIARHSGWYKPLANDVIFFRDPYADVDFSNGYYTGNTGITGNTGNTGNTGTTGTGNPINDEVYKFKVFTLCRYKNTQFYSSHQNFGILKNFFYHKVNQEDPSTILELSSAGAFISLYPLINEVGIDYKDYYIFSSNWEPGYFTKSIDKSKIQSVIGTRSMKEKKAFLASKYLKVPQQITLDTFIPSPFVKDAIKDPNLVDGTFMYNEEQSYVEFYLLIQKRLTEYLFDFVKPVFEKYINPEFGFGDITTLNDDVNNYIEQNVLSLYKIGVVDFYIKNSREKKEPIYTTAELTNSEKTSAGLRIDQNISTKTLNTNLFDLRLIYNKRTGFSDSYGFSVTIVKK
jgi:hypothetical protein